MNNKLSSLVILSLAAVTLGACSSAKDQLGLTRSAPDEFAVVKRAPLELPPDYSLRPPRPGAPRPQEQNINEQARETVFGGSNEARKAAPASGESALLQEAGATHTDPAIREVIDREVTITPEHEKPVTERLLGIKLGNSKTDKQVLNPEEEAARLKAQKAAAEAGSTAAP